MSEELQPQSLTPEAPASPEVAAAPVAAPAEIAAPSSPTPTIDPAEFAYYRDYAERAARAMQDWGIDEHRAKRLSDPKFREFEDQAWSSYEQLQRAAEPQIPPEFKPIADRLDNVVSYVDKLREREQAQTQAEYQGFVSEQHQYAQRLAAERPDLAANGNAGILRVAAFADSLASQLGRRVGIEEAYKEMQRYAAPASSAAPPTSLRAHDGAPGVPGKSSTKPDPSKSFGEVFLARLKAERGA